MENNNSHNSHSNRPRFFPFINSRSRESSPSPRRSGHRTPHRTPSGSSHNEMIEARSRCSTPMTSSTGIFQELRDDSSVCQDSINLSTIAVPPPSVTLRNLIRDSQSRVTAVNQQLSRVEQQIVRCRNAENNICQQIATQYDKYIQILQDRKELALRKVKNIYNKVIQEIATQESHLRKQAERLEQAILEATTERKIEIQVELSSYELLDVEGDPLTLKLGEMRDQFSTLLNETSTDDVIMLPDVKFNIDKDIEFQLKRLGHVIIEVNTPPQDELLKINMGVQSPYGLNVGADNQLHVLDWETNTLYIMDLKHPQNAHKCSLGRSLTRKSVHSVVAAPSGYYISFPNKNALRFVSIELKSSMEITAIDWYVFSRPHGLSLTEKDNIVLADTNNNRVLVCSPDLNKVVFQIKSTEDGEGQFLHPREIAVTPSYDIVVLHEGYPCIHVYSPTGDLRYKFGSIGNPAKELDRPQSLSVASDGDIFVGNVGFIGIYSSDGVSMTRVWRQGVVQRLAVTSDRRVIYRGVSKEGIMIDTCL
ncbi:E3 ubiquitin-protein ligase TRIM71-like [Oopsacas minuta]|uniref:E3 ubiquitin-protein ligase TRIM71-like n=1 Tax=Oopsacas minuta TaxID=111878 RepID=A0AAV7JHL8_9METZ|nr:E3 ubiquitin-protein ligase TRIM71-like [Oopsacas minuta]